MFKREYSNSTRNGNHINMSDDVMQQFERLLVDMEDRLDTTITNLHRGQRAKVPNARKQGRRESRI